MCKDCENNINKNEELEQENMSLEDLSKDELLDVCYELINQKEKQILSCMWRQCCRETEGIGRAESYQRNECRV